MYFKCKKPNFHLYFCALSVNLDSFITGCCLGWSSIAIPRLNSSIEPEHNPLGPEPIITSYQAAWISSLLPLGAAVNSILSSHLADKRGRKEVMVVSTFITIIGFGTMHFAQSVAYICLARFVCGLGIGSTFTVLPTYAREIEKPNGKILSMLIWLSILLGIFFTYTLGTVVTLNELNLINFAPPVLFVMIFDWFMPESPFWLTSQKRFKDAEKSLRKMRNSTDDELSTELAEITRNVEEVLKNKSSFGDLVNRKGFLKGMSITCALVTFQQLSGISIFVFYMSIIFEETEGTFSTDLSCIVIAAVQVLSCVVSTLFIDCIKRKVLLVFSCLGTSLSLVSFGAYFYLKQLCENVEDIDWLPIVSVTCFMIAYTVGLGAVPFIMIEEIFPQQIKNMASASTICITLILAFSVTISYPALIACIGIPYTFWLLAIFPFISIPCIITCLPETRGKSPSDIQEMMINNS